MRNCKWKQDCVMGKGSPLHGSYPLEVLHTESSRSVERSLQAQLERLVSVCLVMVSVTVTLR